MKTSSTFRSLLIAVIIVFAAFQNVNAQTWNTTGNSGTTPGTNFIGTTDKKNFIIKTVNTQRFVVDTLGRIGIATTTPTVRLDVNEMSNLKTVKFYNGYNNSANIETFYSGANNPGSGGAVAGRFEAMGVGGSNTGIIAYVQNGSTNTGVSTGVMTAASQLGYGLYTSSSGGGTNYGTYSYASGSGTSYSVYASSAGTGANYGIYALATGGTNNYGIYARASGGTSWAGYFAGRTYFGDQLLVGTTTAATGYMVSVKGKVICEELKVELSANWPDYVFGKNYKLRSLTDVEKYINQNQHLPGIPAAAEMEKNGLAVGEMQTKLVEKVEELTLYVISLQKQIEELKKNNQ